MAKEELKQYVYVQVSAEMLQTIVNEQKGGITVQVKLDDEGVVVDVLTGEDENIGTAWKTYAEMDLTVTHDVDEPDVVESAALYDLCKHCDHFADEDGTHMCDEEHHIPDDHHKAEGRGEPKTMAEWKVLRPELFTMHGDGLIGPNSAFHKHPCNWE